MTSKFIVSVIISSTNEALPGRMPIPVVNFQTKIFFNFELDSY